MARTSYLPDIDRRLVDSHQTQIAYGCISHQNVNRTGSYASMFYVLTGVVVLLAALAWSVKVPALRT